MKRGKGASKYIPETRQIVRNKLCITEKLGKKRSMGTRRGVASKCRKRKVKGLISTCSASKLSLVFESLPGGGIAGGLNGKKRTSGKGEIRTSRHVPRSEKNCGKKSDF